MADFNHDISFAKDLDPSGRLGALLQRLIESHNNVARQVNATPIGTTPKPPQINSVTVTGQGGQHEITINDNTPSNRGLHYFYEWDISKEFTNPRQKALGPDRQDRPILGVAGPIYVRAFSGYLTSPPSDPVYHGTATTPLGVDAGTAPALLGPPVSSSTGTGTEPSLLPRASAGFGFDNTRIGGIGGPNTSPRE